MTPDQGKSDVGGLSAPDLTRLAASVLTGLANVLWAVAAAVFVMMVAVYTFSADGGGDRQMPHQYWFAVLPLLVAGAGVSAVADRIEKEAEPAA